MTSISVVMACFNDAELLPGTIESVLRQTHRDFEFLIVNDGSTDKKIERILSDYQQQDDRLRIITKKNEGLTKALIDACDSAEGSALARIDAGDIMSPDRLDRQWRVLENHPDTAFVSCYTKYCAPEWEPLWLNKGAPESSEPVSILPEIPESGLTGDIPHHGSVMMRKRAYDKAGGYRAEFYFGQDWDLWYRMAEVGTYMVVPEVLYTARIFPSSISMSRNSDQTKIAQYSLGAFQSRMSGMSEEKWLGLASKIRPSTENEAGNDGVKNHEPGYYFIGEALRRKGDIRCRRYLTKAIGSAPFRPRAYARLIQSIVLPGNSLGREAASS